MSASNPNPHTPNAAPTKRETTNVESKSNSKPPSIQLSAPQNPRQRNKRTYSIVLPNTTSYTSWLSLPPTSTPASTLPAASLFPSNNSTSEQSPIRHTRARAPLAPRDPGFRARVAAHRVEGEDLRREMRGVLARSQINLRRGWRLEHDVLRLLERERAPGTPTPSLAPELELELQDLTSQASKTSLERTSLDAEIRVLVARSQRNLACHDTLTAEAEMNAASPGAAGLGLVVPRRDFKSAEHEHGHGPGPEPGLDCQALRDEVRRARGRQAQIRLGVNLELDLAESEAGQAGSARVFRLAGSKLDAGE